MPKTRTEDIRAVMMDTAKVQLAALNAGIEFWSGWVESASKFALAANKELMELTSGDANADETLSRLTDSTRKYLDAVTELPSRAATRFAADVKETRRNARPRRSAKAKE